MASGSERFPTGGSPRHAKLSKEANLSTSPRNSPRIKQRKPDENDAKKVQQMQAYVAWTNSQLKKLPNGKFVEDLARDMQDGVALSQLIDVVAGEKIAIDPKPSSPAIMNDNVEKVLQFISAKKIRLHHVTAKDIVNGNLKSIMRLILALAAHFKPSTVRGSVSEPRSAGRRVRRADSSLSAVAAEAAATLHDVSRAAASVGTPYGARLRSSKLLNSSASTSSVDSNEKDSKVGGLFYLHDQSVPSAASKRLSTSQAEKVFKRGEKMRNSNGSITSIGKKSQTADSIKTHFSDADSGEGSGTKNAVAKKRVVVSCNQWNEIVDGYGVMENDVRETRKDLLHLQDLLLNQKDNEELLADDSDFSSLDGTLLQEQVTILNARLDQRSSEYDELKNELNRTKEECINLQGTKHGLQSRLSEQEQILMKLKAEFLKLSFSHQAANSDKGELQKLLGERDREIALLRSELLSKDNQLVEHKKKLESAVARASDVDVLEKDLRSKIKTHEVYAGALRSHVKELQQTLRSAGASEVKLSNRITYQDRKVTLLEDKLLRDQCRAKPEELETIQQCLQTLRSSLPGHVPQHPTLDVLEETLASVVDYGFVQFPVNDVYKAVPKNNNYQNGLDTGRKIDEAKSSNTLAPVTRITFHASNGGTPSVASIPKRLGEVTLGDFKSLVDRPEQFRYYFKALDPEFGTIREELVNDHDVIPGWDGQIMAWITSPEDESGEFRNASSSRRSETHI